jgi:hypothetical protein
VSRTASPTFCSKKGSFVQSVMHAQT